MFSVIISEKGGAERRESYDRPDITIGRVQDNDLVLPKGNVSKRHARVRYREGGFIVTDLGSTNGTYVNGRKIPQATIVREGDKIYIGDFVLRIEAGSSVVSPSLPAPAPADPAAEAGSPEPRPAPPEEVAAARAADDPPPAAPRPRAAGPAIAPPPLIDPPSSQQPSSSSAAERSLRPPSPRIEPKTGDESGSAPRALRSDRHDVISHFPLEHDPDESLQVAVPAPPRVPSSPRPIVGPTGGKTLPVPGAQQAGHDGGRPPMPPGPAGLRPGLPTAPGTSVQVPQPSGSNPGVPPAAASPGPSLITGAPPAGSAPATPASPQAIPGAPFPPDRSTAPSVGLAGLGIPPQGRRATADGSRGSAVEIEARAAGPRGTLPLDPARTTAQRAALAALVERVEGAVGAIGDHPPDDALRARIERALADAHAARPADGDTAADTLVAEARRELLELGPLGPLLDDEDVTEIQVIRHDHVVALHGRRQAPSELGFTGEAAVGRAIRRLCRGAGVPLGDGEVFVERRLARGGRLFAVMPRAEDPAHVVVIRKPQRVDLGLEDLVRSGTISRAMAGLFSQCVAARANVLVAGPLGAGTTTLLGALAGAGSTEDRVVVLQEDDELVFNQPHTISILLGDSPKEGARAVQAAARIRPDQLVVGALGGAVAAELVDAMADGADGVIAAARAPSLRQAVLRLAADLAAARPGLSPEVAREQLAGAFDLAIEVARLRDGRHRVLRVAELGVDAGKMVIRDVFTFTVERTAAGGAIEGTFSSTGVVPALLDDLAARGVAVDPAVFRRFHSRPEISEGAQAGPASPGPGAASPRQGR